MATIGTISHGTLRTIDLLRAFADELEELDADGKYAELIAEARDLASSEVNAESASDVVAELEDALNEFAPPYCYFGAHPGDGSDLGFWPDKDLTTEAQVIERMQSIHCRREALCVPPARSEHHLAFARRQAKIAKLTEREDALRRRLCELRDHD